MSEPVAKEDRCAECARYENGRVILTQMIEDQKSEGIEQARLLGMSAEREAALRSKLEQAERERDQYKQMAEINANTIKCMQAAVNLHAARIDEVLQS